MNLPALCFVGITFASIGASVIIAASKSLYVGELDGTLRQVNLRETLVRELKHVGRFEIAKTPEASALILTGTNHIRVRGYVSLNPRSGNLPSEGQPVYGGYVSIELKDRTGATVWSYVAVPGSGTNGMDRMANEIAKHLVSAVGKGK